jgi:hypothetical protein
LIVLAQSLSFEVARGIKPKLMSGVEMRMGPLRQAEGVLVDNEGLFNKRSTMTSKLSVRLNSSFY